MAVLGFGKFDDAVHDFYHDFSSMRILVNKSEQIANRASFGSYQIFELEGFQKIQIASWISNPFPKRLFKLRTQGGLKMLSLKEYHISFYLVVVHGHYFKLQQ